MRLLVTGATGLAGKYIIQRLAGKENYILCVVRDKDKFLKLFDEEYVAQVSFHEMKEPENLTADDYKNIVEQHNIDTVIHNAALAREYSIKADKYYKINVLWTKNLATGFLKSTVKHNRFIYISSVGVYGTNPKVCPAKETIEYDPDGKYHTSKMEAEKELIKLRENQKLPLIILRPSIMYGMGDYGFVHKLFKLVSKGIFPLSTKSYNIHLLDLETFAESIEFAMINHQKDNYIYNISDKNPVEIRILIEYIRKNFQGNFIQIPSFIFYLLKLISIYNPAMSIKFKLISESWSYDVSSIENDMGIKLNETTANLGKYMEFYKRAINGNK